jgi:hypothetical protein
MPLSLERFIGAIAIMALISAVGVFIGWKWGLVKGGAFFRCRLCCDHRRCGAEGGGLHRLVMRTQALCRITLQAATIRYTLRL